METKALLEEKVREEIEKNLLPSLTTAWSEFQLLLASAAPREFLLLVKRDKLELAVGADDLMVTLLVDRKHFLVTAVELGHMKGVDLSHHEMSGRKGSEIQLNVWFLDNTRFYWESGPEDLEQIRNFALYVRGFLGRPPKD